MFVCAFIGLNLGDFDSPIALRAKNESGSLKLRALSNYSSELNQ